MPGERAQSVQKRITSVRWKYSKLSVKFRLSKGSEIGQSSLNPVSHRTSNHEKRDASSLKRTVASVCRQWITPQSLWYPSPFLLPTDPHINYVAETRCLCWLLSIFLPILGFLLFLGPNSSFSGFKWYKASSTGNNPALVAPLSLPHHFPSVVKQAQRVFSLNSTNERWQHICESALQFSEVQSNTATHFSSGFLSACSSSSFLDFSSSNEKWYQHIYVRLIFVKWSHCLLDMQYLTVWGSHCSTLLSSLQSL